MVRHGFDFSEEHLSALHTVPQLNDLGENDFVVVGATVTDCGIGSYRAIGLNVAFVMRIGHIE